MICVKCNTEMKIGTVIDAGLSWMQRAICSFDKTIKAEDVKLIDCWKCPKCGHSEDL